MTKITKRKITIFTLKSIRAIAWMVATITGCFAIFFFFCEPTAALGDFAFILFLVKKVIFAIVLFAIAIGASFLAMSITDLLKNAKKKKR